MKGTGSQLRPTGCCTPWLSSSRLRACRSMLGVFPALPAVSGSQATPFKPHLEVDVDLGAPVQWLAVCVHRDGVVARCLRLPDIPAHRGVTIRLPAPTALLKRCYQPAGLLNCLSLSWHECSRPGRQRPSTRTPLWQHFDWSAQASDGMQRRIGTSSGYLRGSLRCLWMCIGCASLETHCLSSLCLLTTST